MTEKVIYTFQLYSLDYPRGELTEMEKGDEKFLTEITTHALKSRCACKVCHRLRERHIAWLEKKVEKE
ncbi:MAG: hypothetical protein PVH12_06770 [Candidatus Bathyarchaeota archaeon]|jgi:hypothetical protein